MSKKLKWIVEFSIDEIWVEDGFEIDKERATSMLEHELCFAYPNEFSAKIIQAPPKDIIRKIQGYVD